MTETFAAQSETLRESGVSLCTKAFFCFNGQNYLFNLSKTIELLKKNSELSIVNEFPQNDTLASHAQYNFNICEYRWLFSYRKRKEVDYYIFLSIIIIIIFGIKLFTVSL